MLLAVAWSDILFVFNKLPLVYFCKYRIDSNVY